MKKIKIHIIFFSVILLISCSSNQGELTEVEGPVAEEASEFVKLYKDTMVEAVNTGNFNILEPYLITNNNFYHSLRRYIDDLTVNRVSKELNSFVVEAVYTNEYDEIFVNVREKVSMQEGTEIKTVERHTQYYLIKINHQFRVETIVTLK